MRLASGVAVAVAALLAAGCLVDVQRVADPRPAFARAREEAHRAAERSGRPDRLEVLVYDHDEGKLVRASLPLWLARELDRNGSDWDGDEAVGRAGERVRSRLRWKDIEKAGRGILAEVEEEEGDQVLVWLR
jgi:hypothetical protein